jgi:hypothetical protein
MKEGLSTNRHCDPFADCLVQAGKQFVIRYHSSTTQQPEKRLSPLEAASLARAGLEIATVYQDRARQPSDFGLTRGRQDGAAAHTFAAQVGQPAGSAIYFAVDADFSAAEIDSFVLPYFHGVKEGLDQAAGGTSGFAIGVYGSGLTCRKVRDEAGAATFAWLAESTGWRESRTYAKWDVRQHVNAAQLCGLGENWEPCEARDQFGQFRPIGFDVHAAQGRRMRVSASQLNLRVAPSTSSNPPIAQLPEGLVVRVLGEAAPPWLRVRATLGGSDVIGYASGKFMQAVDEVPAPETPAPTLAAAVPAVPAVHYRENDPASRRSSTGRRAQPLGELQRPSRDPAAPEDQRRQQVLQIIDWLAVDTSARYQPDTFTYCNVYAADLCYLAHAYLPRTWWTESALARLAAGQQVPVLYDSTIREMRADDLCAWLIEWGTTFGWRRVFDATALQAAANAGGLGLICADRDAAGRPGHISVVVPESGANVAQRDVDGHVVLPLQSQAGAVNFRHQTGKSAWWLDVKFKAHVFFVHD